MIKVFEAFSGIGTQRMALRNLGIEHEVVAISEIDKFAIKSYEAIHGETNNLGDISKINADDIPDHDLFTYSFPCQDISIVGKQGGLNEGSGTRSSLLWECKRMIEHKRPKYLLLENVKNLVGKKHKEDFDSWLSYLNDLGYTNYWEVLNAKDFGVPQNRERVFVVSILGEHEEYKFPEKQELDIRLKDVLEDEYDYEVDDKFYLDDFKINRLTFKEISKFNDTSEKINQIGQYNTPTRINSNRYRVYGCGGLSPTLTTMRGGDTIPHIIKNDFRIRKLTPLECWRLMGISDEDFYKAQDVNSNSQLYKQAGNSIVVQVLEAIFKELLKEEKS